MLSIPVQRFACEKSLLVLQSEFKSQVQEITIDDVDLVEQLQRGSQTAFSMLLNRWQNRVYTQCYQHLQRQDLAEEATQEIFVKVYQGISKFQYKSKFSTWLFRIVRNHCINVHQYNNRRKQDFHDPLEGTNPDHPRQLAISQDDPQEAQERKELKTLVHTGLAKLSDSQREVLVLRDIQEFSYEEIGNILKVSTGTVKSRVHRAREALKPILLKLLEK